MPGDRVQARDSSRNCHDYPSLAFSSGCRDHDDFWRHGVATTCPGGVTRNGCVMGSRNVVRLRDVYSDAFVTTANTVCWGKYIQEV